MGACNSTGQLVSGLDQRCGRRGRNSSSSSCSSELGASSARKRAANNNNCNSLPAAKLNGNSKSKLNSASPPAGRPVSLSSAAQRNPQQEGVEKRRAPLEPPAPPRPTNRRPEPDSGRPEEPARVSGAPRDAEARKELLDKLKEGVDFIETEEDAEAVESAVVRIQSTFRGKKIRSKLNQNNNNNNNNQSEQQKQQAKDKTEPSTAKVSADELSKKVANMEVNDKADKQQAATNLPEDEAQRAATKIQAGFKGYKTRKELEGIIASGQPATAAGQEEQQQEAAAKS